MQRLVLTALIAALLTGCGTPAGGHLGAKLVIGQAPAARPALVAVAAPASRVLAEGTFTLPASLVSIGSGGLVSIGSGGLVSIGSGGLVSIGSGGYRVLAADGAADVAIPGALITLARPRGEAIDGAYEVAPAQSGAGGGYRLHGRAPAGLFRVAASIGGHTFMTLVALTSDAPARAPIDAATTLVAAGLLAEHPTGDLSVLPMQTFGQSVAAVRAAIAAGALPPGWTPDRAVATMAELERKHPAIARAMSELREHHASTERRETAFGYRLQELATSLGVPPELVADELSAVLSVSPEASDAEIDAEVESAVRRRLVPADAPSPASSEAPAAAPTPAPGATPGATPSASPSAEAAGAPTAEPSIAPAADATYAEGADKDDEAIEAEMANEEARSKGRGKNQPAEPAEAPSAEPSQAPDGSPAEADEGDSDAPQDGGEAEAGDDDGNGNAGGNNGHTGGDNGNAGNNGHAGGNGNANGQNDTQGQGNGGTNNGNGGATNGNGGTNNGSGGATNGNGGATNANGGATNGNGGATNANGGATNGSGGATNGSGGATNGNGNR